MLYGFALVTKNEKSIKKILIKCTITLDNNKRLAYSKKHERDFKKTKCTAADWQHDTKKPLEGVRKTMEGAVKIALYG